MSLEKFERRETTEENELKETIQNWNEILQWVSDQEEFLERVSRPEEEVIDLLKRAWEQFEGEDEEVEQQVREIDKLFGNKITADEEESEDVPLTEDMDEE